MLKGRTVGYARISSVDPNLDQQLEELEQEFKDKARGTNVGLPAFQRMMEYIRQGGIIVVCCMDKPGDDKRARAQDVNICSMEDSILHYATRSDGTKTNLVSMLGSAAEFECFMVREPSRDGIELAKSRGVYRGKTTDSMIIEQTRKKIYLSTTVSV